MPLDLQDSFTLQLHMYSINMAFQYLNHKVSSTIMTIFFLRVSATLSFASIIKCMAAISSRYMTLMT